MCGRIDQNENPRLYLNSIGWTDAALHSQAEPRYNVPPGTYRPVVHVQDGEQRMDDVFWSYRPAWAAAAEPKPGKRRIPIAINAKVEKIEGAYWKPLLRAGRGVVCASGWYEWTGPKGSKQPWHIHRSDGRPLFLAALANFGPPSEVKTANGFTIVTADAQGGMVDVHDRRPVVLDAADAVLWLDPGLASEHAELLLRSMALGADAFDWHMVDRAVGNVTRQGPHLIVPVA